MGQNRKGVIEFSPQTNLILLFGPRITVQNFIKIAAVGVFTDSDRMTEVIL